MPPHPDAGALDSRARDRLALAHRADGERHAAGGELTYGNHCLLHRPSPFEFSGGPGAAEPAGPPSAACLGGIPAAISDV